VNSLEVCSVLQWISFSVTSVCCWVELETDSLFCHSVFKYTSDPFFSVPDMLNQPVTPCTMTERVSVYHTLAQAEYFEIDYPIKGFFYSCCSAEMGNND